MTSQRFLLFLCFVMQIGLSAASLKTKQAAGLTYLEQSGDKDGAYILLLHGYGGRAENLLSLADLKLSGPKPTWIFPVGPLEIPYSNVYTGRAWFALDSSEDIENTILPGLTTSGKQMIRFIKELDIPLDQLFIGGFSQGAILSCEVAFHLPEKIGGLLLLSGTLVNKAEWKKSAPKQSGVPFFLSHGTNDTVLPLSGALQLEQLLLQAGLKGQLLKYPGGHGIPVEVMEKMGQFLGQHIQKEQKSDTSSLRAQAHMKMSR